MNYPKIYESFYYAGKIAALQKLADPGDRRSRIEAMFPTLDPSVREQMINNQQLTDADISRMEQANAKKAPPSALQRGISSIKQTASDVNDSIAKTLGNPEIGNSINRGVDRIADIAQNPGNYLPQYTTNSRGDSQITIPGYSGKKSKPSSGPGIVERIGDTLGNPEIGNSINRGTDAVINGVSNAYSGLKSRASDFYNGMKGIGENMLDSINDATGQNANDYYRDMVTQYGHKDSKGNPIFPTGNMTSKAKIDYANNLRNKNVNAKARTDYLMQERNKPSRVPGNFEFPMRDATPAPAGLQLIDNPMSKQYNELVRQGENIRRNTYSPVIDGLNSQISSGNFGAAPAQRPAQQSPARPQGRGLVDRLLLRHPNSPMPTIPTFGSGPTTQATPPRQKSTLADMQRLSARLTNRAPNANSLPVNQALRGVFGGGGQATPATPSALNMRQVASPNGYQRRG